MNTNPALADAIAIFKTLNWHEATPDQALNLPVGTPEQQRTALAGLRYGDWGKFGQIQPNTYGYKSAVDVDETMLMLFAIRIGVSAKRVAHLIHYGQSETVLPVIESRGRQFMEEFITETTKKDQWSISYAVELVLRNHLPIPKNSFYLDHWVAVASSALQQHPDYQPLAELSLVKPSFRAHLELAFELATVLLAPLLAQGLDHGLISPTMAQTAAFNHIQTAIRPSDRKAWADFIFSKLQPTDVDLCAGADAFAQLVATGEAPMVEHFAVRLIPLVTSHQLSDIALGGLYARTNKAIKAVLSTLTAIPLPDQDVIDALTPRLVELHNSHDKQIAKLATCLLRSWNITASTEPVTPIDLSLWQKPPAIAQLPRFDRGAVGVETLGAALQEISKQDTAIDVQLERFLALACALSQSDPVAAERVLGGAKDIFDGMLTAWADGSIKPWSRLAKRNENLHSARLKAVFTHLGTIPCLLSEPSYADLSITAADFNERLRHYADAGAYILEPDLVLALARVAPTDLPQLQEENIPIELDDGSRLRHSAAKIIRNYKKDPFTEPALTCYRGIITTKRFSYPQSLRDLPPRLHVTHWHSDVDFTVFPHFGNAAYRCLHWSQFVADNLGALALQAARSAKPLPPAGAMNLLALLRQKNKYNEQCAEAVRLAWRNGLLQPGVADYTFADWQEEPILIAKLVAELVDVANEGLLAVVWPILDQIIQKSLTGTKLATGTAAAASAMQSFAPIVAAAAPETAWQVPGLRALAQRKGTAQAVVIARETVALLPNTHVASPAETTSCQVGLSEQDFHRIWTTTANTEPKNDDVTVTLSWQDSAKKPKRIMVTLTANKQHFNVFKETGWTYDLAYEHQCQASDSDGNEVYLYWDVNTDRVASSPVRNRIGGNDAPLEHDHHPLCQMLLTIVIAHLSDEKHASFYQSVIRTYIEHGVITPQAISRSMQQVLPFPAFSPAKAVYDLETTPTLLPWLWPMLTESLSYAAELVRCGDSAPRWINKVLDVVKLHSPILMTATTKGFIPAQSWAGLTVLANMKKSAARTKAQELTKLFVT